MAGDRTRKVLLIADHARNQLPGEYGTLGLPASELERHIGYDIGVEALVTGLAQRLNLPAVISGFSRLLIDPNRGVDDPTLIMQLSDGAIVPGNVLLDATEREARLNRFYRPYHAAIDAEIDAMIAAHSAPVLLSVHSFTPAWKGVSRPWHAGLLWEDDRRLSDLFIAALTREPGLVVGDNEPYAGGLEGDCMNMHAVRRNLPHTLLEVRQDLISDERGVVEWTDRLATIIEQLIGSGQIEALHDTMDQEK